MRFLKYLGIFSIKSPVPVYVLGLSIFIFFNSAFGESETRYEIELDWPEVEEARGYEMEFESVSEKRKPIIVKVKNPYWKGGLPLGLYNVRMRSLDARLVPGEWSGTSELAVYPPPPKIIGPQATLNSNQTEKDKVKFSWEAVPGAHSYMVSVKSDESSFKVEKESKTSEIQLEIPVAQKLSWEVYSLVEGVDKKKLAFNIGHFNHVGRIPSPEPIPPTSEIIENVEWKDVPNAKGYAYSLYQLKGKDEWQQLEKKKTKQAKAPIDPKYTGGAYRLKVIAIGDKRKSATPVVIDFTLARTRGPAAIKEARMIEAVERPALFHALGSYIITNLGYQAANPERATKTSFSALGGSGRLGLGYSPKGKWGAMGFMEFSGFTVSGQTFTYFTSELDGTYKMKFGSKLLKLSSGLFIKELPEALSNVLNPKELALEKVRFLGPQAGVSYAIPFSESLGLQINTRIYLSMMSMGTPNDESVKTGLSYQLSLLGSYRVNRNMTGMFGYALKKDTISYGARASDNNPDSFATEGDVNSISVSGHYLNLMLEWGF